VQEFIYNNGTRQVHMQESIQLITQEQSRQQESNTGKRISTTDTLISREITK